MSNPRIQTVEVTKTVQISFTFEHCDEHSLVVVYYDKYDYFHKYIHHVRASDTGEFLCFEYENVAFRNWESVIEAVKTDILKRLRYTEDV